MFFSVFEILLSIAFVFILAVMIGIVIRGIGTWNRNNHSPRLSVTARVVAKRVNVSQDSTRYYVTFQVESGDRMELHVSGTEYGQIAEGDTGILSFQGTRFLTFERNR